MSAPAFQPVRPPGKRRYAATVPRRRTTRGPGCSPPEHAALPVPRRSRIVFWSLRARDSRRRAASFTRGFWRLVISGFMNERVPWRCTIRPRSKSSLTNAQVYRNRVVCHWLCQCTRTSHRTMISREQTRLRWQSQWHTRHDIPVQQSICRIISDQFPLGFAGPTLPRQRATTPLGNCRPSLLTRTSGSKDTRPIPAACTSRPIRAASHPGVWQVSRRNAKRPRVSWTQSVINGIKSSSIFQDSPRGPWP